MRRPAAYCRLLHDSSCVIDRHLVMARHVDPELDPLLTRSGTNTLALTYAGLASTACMHVNELVCYSCSKKELKYEACLGQNSCHLEWPADDSFLLVVSHLGVEPMIMHGLNTASATACARRLRSSRERARRLNVNTTEGGERLVRAALQG